MGLGLGLGIWWSTQTSIIPGLLKLLEARADYFENKICTTATLKEIAAVRYTPPPPPGLLLEDYPGASAAYSLRNLIDTTTSVVRVRRSSDNAEQDFTSAEITDGTLATFCSGTDGFVAIWYDQSGNSNNAVQTAALTQPKIVSNGNITLLNGKPYLICSTTNHMVKNYERPSYAFCVVEFNDLFGGSSIRTVFGSGGGGLRYVSGNIKSNDGYDYVYQENVWYSNNVLTNPFPKNQLTLISAKKGTSYSFGSSNSKILNSTSNRGVGGYVSEIILYPTDQSANRAGIETNINTEYTIY